ncbi:MAG: LptF/LptG family permease [Opitutales bacterium]
MNLYDRHLLREWLKILGLVLGAMTGLLLVQVLYDDFRTLNDLNARAEDFLRYVLVTLPGFLALVLPVGLLVSLLFVLGKLHRANEFVALRAAGVGIMRITAPIWAVGVLACGVTWFLNASVVPWSVEASRTLRESLQFRYQSRTMPEDRIGVVYSVAFDNQTGRRMWFFNRYSQFTQRAYGVTVSELDADRRERLRLDACEAWYDPAQRGWMFSHGQELTIDPGSGEVVAPRAFDQLFRPDFPEDPQLMLLIDRRPLDLSFFELRRLINYYSAEDNPKGLPYAVRYFGLLADTLGPLIVIALAVPFSVSGVRVNPVVGVSKSIGLFFLYYILMNAASSMATKHLVDPMVAAWLPNIGMSAIALWLFARLR